MANIIEQEIKLAFESAGAARAAVTALGARLVTPRRLLTNQLFDASDNRLQAIGSALRVRRDGDRALLTFKGPVQPGVIKSRTEVETPVDHPREIVVILEALGFRPWFLYENRREEYTLGNAHVSVDETPIGSFIEIEGDPDTIARTAALLGRGPADYIRESYRTLYVRWCETKGMAPNDMTFAIRE